MSQSADEAWRRVTHGMTGDIHGRASDLRKATEETARDVAREVVANTASVSIGNLLRRVTRLEARVGDLHPAPSEDTEGEVQPVAWKLDNEQGAVGYTRHRAQMEQDKAAGARITPLYSHETVQRLQKEKDDWIREARLLKNAVAARVLEIEGLQQRHDEIEKKYRNRHGRLEEAKSEIAVLERRCKKRVDQLAEAREEIARLRESVDRLQSERNGEVWLWQGDGSDEPDSLSCPVVMHPEDLRKLLAEIAGLQRRNDNQAETIASFLEDEKKQEAEIARLRDRDPIGWRNRHPGSPPESEGESDEG